MNYPQFNQVQQQNTQIIRQINQLSPQGDLNKLVEDFKKYSQVYLLYTCYISNYTKDNYHYQVRDNNPSRISLEQICKIWRHERKDDHFSRLFILVNYCSLGIWKQAQLVKQAGITIYAAYDKGMSPKNSGQFFKCLFEADKDFQTNYKNLTHQNCVPQRLEQGQIHKTSKGEMITLFNVLRKSSNWITASKVEPAYRQKLPGLISQGQCKSSDCPAFGKLVYCNRGMGVFNSGKQSFQARCPLCHQKTKKVVKLHFYKANSTFEGIMDQTGKPHNGTLWATDDEIHTIFDASNDKDQWSYLEIQTKPLQMNSI